MKFTIDKSIYINLLNKVKKNLSAGTDENVMKYILHEVRNGELKITASNYKSKAEYSLMACDFLSLEEDGVACIHGNKLIDLVNAFSEGNIIISKIDEDSMSLSFASEKKKKNNYIIPCINSNLYPTYEFTLDEDHSHIKISPDKLKYILKNTEYASSKDDSADMSLMNVYLEAAEDKIYSAGLSMEMMAYSIFDRDHDVSGNGTFYIMNYAIKDLISLLDDINDIDLMSDGKVLMLKQSRFVYYIRMLNVVFPDWKSKVGIEFQHKAKINKELFLGTLKQIKTISSLCKVSIGNNILNINSVSSDVLNNSISYAEEQLDCDSDGENNVILIIELLLEAFNKTIDEDVIIYFNNDPRHPIKFRIDQNSSLLMSTLKE